MCFAKKNIFRKKIKKNLTMKFKNYWTLAAALSVVLMFLVSVHVFLLWYFLPKQSTPCYRARLIGWEVLKNK